jgi:hypothetical protein
MAGVRVWFYREDGSMMEQDFKRIHSVDIDNHGNLILYINYEGELHVEACFSNGRWHSFYDN